MAASVDRFFTEEQSFQGLDRLSDKVERRQFRADQMAEREEAKKATTGRFLANYLDSKDYLTGTYYDPQIVEGFQELLSEGASLAHKGADPNMLMMALAPKVNKLSQYSTKAKLLNENLKRQMGLIKPNAGYDIPKLEQEARKAAFFDATGKLKDINTVDPQMDWVSETIKMFPERVTTDAGFDEFVKNSPKFTNTSDITSYTPTGGMSRKKVKITSPNWLVPNVDNKGVTTGLVPRYQTALDNGQPLMHEFTDDKGNKVSAAVRLLDEKEFNSLMGQNSGIADWVRGQVRKANPDIDLNSPQATMLARAIAYDELKRRSPGGIEDVEISKPTQVRNITNINTGGSSDSQVRDIYQPVVDKIKDLNSRGVSYADLKELESDSADAIYKAVVNKGYKYLTQDDIKVGVDEDNQIKVYYSDKYISENDVKPLITTLTRVGMNLKPQPGVKEKREVIQQGEPKTKQKLIW